MLCVLIALAIYGSITTAEGHILDLVPLDVFGQVRLFSSVCYLDSIFAFLAVIAGMSKGWQCWSVSQFIILVHTEISSTTIE